MRILHTSELYYPSVGGAQEVVRQISERLSRKGHDVTVATTRLPKRKEYTINDVKISEFSIFGNENAGYTGEVEKFREFILKGEFDIIMNYAAEQWTSDTMIPILDQIDIPKIFVPCGFFGIYMRSKKNYYKNMPEILKKYDHIVFTSPNYRDARLAIDAGVDHFSIIPNGAGVEEFDTPDLSFRKKHAIGNDRFVFLTVGTHTGLKGHDLVIRAFQRARLRSATLIVIGNRLPDQGCWEHCINLSHRLEDSFRRQDKNLLFLDPTRKDVVSAFFSADAVVIGSRIEVAPLVLLESMAAGTPVVTVDCGNSAEIVTREQCGLVVKTRIDRKGFSKGSQRDLSKAMALLHGDRDLAMRMGRAGRQAWREKYTWDPIANTYESLYLSLIESRNERGVKCAH